MKRLVGGWSEDPLWGSFYDWTVEHPGLGAPMWRIGVGSDLRRLYDAAAEIGRLPAGSRVLDVPCGGGVALRGLHPGQGVDYVAADISPVMLERTLRRAVALGVEDQVDPQQADVGELPFDDGSFDLVVTFTGLHCFPDPRRAVQEMTRVLTPGGAITGSAVLNDSGARFEPLRRMGRLSNLLGPSCTSADVLAWLAEGDVRDARLTLSGAIGYFRGVKSES